MIVPYFRQEEQEKRSMKADMKNTKNHPGNSRMYEFSQDGNACIIKEPKTPRYWYNYLWNEDRYCAQVSQTGHGRSYYLS